VERPLLLGLLHQILIRPGPAVAYATAVRPSRCGGPIRDFPEWGLCDSGPGPGLKSHRWDLRLCPARQKP